ncbi:hypothetical protein A3D04_03850 [Candidatus Curtissbacteria bacterium RIFCSPHIGHO2_02_FULL_40_16b]|uniref:GPI inositol-deacylase PGAP1-like alpha/beta domain-containing protein n=1 Tax=Candidatus Curtissbacteria bacterium RIFCSPHIGHO2_02_FULL_40_16b TaxID=1797714 RepID=A0A1F5GBX3_9BACT|nr:MAG: hypothetical protein A3D04_03850 [Candidatus Curtissbacteria bacterium RIFCSPHIGHO2_02_FULL_40_16b]
MGKYCFISPLKLPLVLLNLAVFFTAALVAALFGSVHAEDLKPELVWQRSTEEPGKVVQETSIGSKVNEALNLPLDPNQVVFDNGVYNSNANGSSIPSHISYASWRQYSSNGASCGPIFDLRHFQAKFNLGNHIDISKIENFILRSPYYPGNTFPINDNAYIYLNGNEISKLGTSYGAANLGFNGTAPYANETDGWFANGNLGLIPVQFLKHGENVIDIVAGEWCLWGGMGKLELVLEIDGPIPPPQPDPVIIVPGIVASFNWEVLGDFVDFTDANWSWSPGAENAWKDFQRSLELAGLVENQDYFVAFYDWRKTNDWTTSTDFQPQDYLRAKIDEAKAKNPQAQKVDIIAHSFGGIVARSYIQSPFYRNDIDQLITIGTPHQGSAFSYYTWEGGVAPPTWDLITRIALEGYAKYLEAKHNKDRFDIVHQFIKSIKDLLPINYNFLYRQEDGSEINWLAMTEINTFLKDVLTANNAVELIVGKGVQLINVASQTEQTWRQIEVVPYQEAFGKFWKDGKPTDNHLDEAGDRTVLYSSAVLPGAQVIEADGDHSAIIKNVSEEIFAELEIPYQEPAESTPIIERIFGIFGGSPIEIEVRDPSGNLVGESTQDPETGFIILLVENPLDDIYQITVNGTDNGTYHLTLLWADEDSTLETEISGFSTAGSQTTYEIDLSDQDNILDFTRSDTIDSLIENVQTAYSLGLIKNKGLKTSLQNTAKNNLPAFINHLQAQRGKGVEEKAVNIFIEIANYLIKNF